MPNCGLVLWVALIGILANALTDASGFEPDRVHFIDHNVTTGNFLFRGNLPVVNKTFALAELNATLGLVAQKEANLTLPGTFYLIVVSLLDPLEFPDAEVERKFFEQNPSIGEYVSWVIIGSLLNPEKEPESLRKFSAKSLKHDSFDRIAERIPKLKTMLDTPATIPRVLYVHCEAGMDRTGEVSGSYYMKIQNSTFSHALAVDNSVETRSIHEASKYGMQWYCYYLKYTTDDWRTCQD